MDSTPKSLDPERTRRLTPSADLVLIQEPGLWQLCHTHQTAIPLCEQTADLTQVKIGEPAFVTKSDSLFKCGWWLHFEAEETDIKTHALVVEHILHSNSH